MLARLMLVTGCVPVAAMTIAALTGLELSDYSHVSQHMSELQLRDDYTRWSIKITATLAGLSVCAFTTLFSIAARRFSFTALTALIFGIAMTSNGIIDIGSPYHGLMGLVMFAALTPALFVAEFPDWSKAPWFKWASLAMAVANLTYFWALLVGLEPQATIGLTQRGAAIYLFGWYVLAAIAITRTMKPEPTPQATTA